MGLLSFFLFTTNLIILSLVWSNLSSLLNPTSFPTTSLTESTSINPILFYQYLPNLNYAMLSVLNNSNPIFFLLLLFSYYPQLKEWFYMGLVCCIVFYQCFQYIMNTLWKRIKNGRQQRWSFASTKLDIASWQLWLEPRIATTQFRKTSAWILLYLCLVFIKAIFIGVSIWFVSTTVSNFYNVVYSASYDPTVSWLTSAQLSNMQNILQTINVYEVIWLGCSSLEMFRGFYILGKANA